jgi:hypothetical protein
MLGALLYSGKEKSASFFFWADLLTRAKYDKSQMK